MKQKNSHHILNRYVVSSLVIAVIVVVSFSVFLVKHDSAASAAQKPKELPLISNASVHSKFSFAGALLWYQGATAENDIALFHHKDGCFVSLQYKTGTVNAATALQNIITTMANGDRSATPVAIQNLTLQTNVGTQLYQLHQYSATNSSSEGMIEGGQEYGFVPVSKGYVSVQADCATVAELPSTLTALRALKFNETN